MREKIKKNNPQRIGAKLKAIRRHLHYSQTEIMKLVTPHTDPNLRATISQWETGTKFPTLTAVLKYARLARVSCEVLLDDRLDLPERFHVLDSTSNRRARPQATVVNQTKISPPVIER